MHPAAQSTHPDKLELLYLGVIMDHLTLESLGEVVPCGIVGLSSSKLTNLKEILIQTNLRLFQNQLLHYIIITLEL
jgi:hypothetical protein